MIFEEEFIVKATHKEAWEFFTDFPSPIMVLPGLVYVRQTTPNRYLLAAEVRIGPLNFRFEGAVNVTAVDNRGYRVNMEGEAQDPVLGGHFQAKAYTQTLPHGPKHSRVIIQVEAGLGGILGKFGKFLLAPRARSIVETYRQLCDKEIHQRRLARALTVTLPNSSPPLTTHSATNES